MNITVETFVSPIFAENCYILRRAGDHRCVVVDPGLQFQDVLEHLTRERLSPEAVLLTHGHADHIAGVEPFKRCFPECPVVIGEGDAPKLGSAELNLSAQYGFDLTVPPADVLCREGDTVEYAGIAWQVLETPGHSAGHVVYLCKAEEPWTVWGGDVLFREGVGRTDFPDGNSEHLVHSIRYKLFTLPDDTVVYPGHGRETTIGYEKQANPFVGATAPRRRFR